MSSIFNSIPIQICSAHTHLPFSLITSPHKSCLFILNIFIAYSKPRLSLKFYQKVASSAPYPTFVDVKSLGKILKLHFDCSSTVDAFIRGFIKNLSGVKYIVQVYEL